MHKRGFDWTQGSSVLILVPELSCSKYSNVHGVYYITYSKLDGFFLIMEPHNTASTVL